MRPRRRGEETSDMYSGETMDASPTPNPPTSLDQISTSISHARAHPILQITKRKPDASRTFFRPNRSLSVPASPAPIAQPSRAELTSQPSMGSEEHTSELQSPCN